MKLSVTKVGENAKQKKEKKFPQFLDFYFCQNLSTVACCDLMQKKILRADSI
jgi:hypothetical protein